MKIRIKYVSNSSSSSFIIKEDLRNQGINCIKLTEEQKRLINGYKNWDQEINLDLDKEYWLTQFISDCYEKYDIVTEKEHIFYQEGQLNETPRNEDFYNEYQGGEFDTSVYLLKKHDESKQMSLNEFVKEYKKTDLPQEFIVKYEDDGIKLIYVW